MGKTTKKESTVKTPSATAKTRASAKAPVRTSTPSTAKAITAKAFKAKASVAATPAKSAKKVTTKKTIKSEASDSPLPNVTVAAKSRKTKALSAGSAGIDLASDSPVTSKRPARKPIVEPDAREVIRASALKAAQYALEKKAVDVRLLDLKDITTMTDFFVIATGDSDRQVKAIAENVIAEMRDTEGIGSWRSEGWDGLQWVLVDFVDFVVHIFQTEARQYYNLERLWADAPSQEIKDEPVVEKATRKKKSPAKGKAAEETEEYGRELASGVRVISEFKEVGGEDH